MQAMLGANTSCTPSVGPKLMHAAQGVRLSATGSSRDGSGLASDDRGTLASLTLLVAVVGAATPLVSVLFARCWLGLGTNGCLLLPRLCRESRGNAVKEADCANSADHGYGTASHEGSH